jgi:hypothetical protein
MTSAARAEPIYAAPPRITANPPSITDNPILAFFLRYWNEKRGDRAMPSRDAISPREIKPYLGWICLLEALPDYKDFRYRLVGSRVSDYFLDDGTGKTVSETFLGEDRLLGEGALWLYRTTCASKAPLRVESLGSTWRGRYYPDNDALYLPLAHDGATPDMVLIAFTFDHDAYRKTLDRYSLTRSAGAVS